MTSEELRLKLLLLGFVGNEKETFGVNIDAYTYEEDSSKFTMYYSRYSDNWFYIREGHHHRTGKFKKPSRKMIPDVAYKHILNKLGIENG